MIYVGKIVNTHGIKGELRILSNFKYKNEIFKQNQNNIDNMNENRSNIEESMEKPSFLNNNSNDNVNKSQEILQQINSYLDNEKKNLN